MTVLLFQLGGGKDSSPMGFLQKRKMKYYRSFLRLEEGFIFSWFEGQVTSNKILLEDFITLGHVE